MRANVAIMSIWQAALVSEVGIILAVSNVDTARQKLWLARKELPDTAYDELEIRIVSAREFGGEIAIVHKAALEADAQARPTNRALGARPQTLEEELL